MKSLRQKDRQTILTRRSRSRNSFNGDEYSEPIPYDLIIEILSRLPGRSITRCRCLSKLWASILSRPDFTESFFARSSARPLLLFAFVKDHKAFFFSSPQPQNPDENYSPISADYHMNLPCHSNYHSFGHVGGLVCLKGYLGNGRKNPLMICNPSTGQSFNLPTLKMRKGFFFKNFFGYDPIEKRAKVLLVTCAHVGDGLSKDFEVLTLETDKKMSWRKIECGTPVPYPIWDGHICISGVLYYIGDCMIVCFDFRSEKFNIIRQTQSLPGATLIYYQGKLINYKGKLGLLMPEGSYYLTGASTSFQMLVLEDPEKHKWSKHIYELPMWQYVEAKANLYFVGMTCTNEIVLSPYFLSDPFYVFYYSLERKTIRRVEIQGIGVHKGVRVSIFLDHVEDVKLMKVL